jgi:hypothetical protein
LVILLVSSEEVLLVCILLYQQHTTCRKKERRKHWTARLVWTLDPLFCRLAASKVLYAEAMLMDEETVFFFETDEEPFLNHMSKGAKTCCARKKVCRTH